MRQNDPGKSGQSRIGSVDVLRCVAATAVLWCHVCNATGHPALKAFGSWGLYGVEVFFVISGFIIPLSMYRAGYSFPRSTPRFIACRLARLDPPYFAAAAGAACLLYASAHSPGFRGSAPAFSWAATVAHLGYLNDLLGLPWYNPVSWTLAIEFQFYLLVAIAFPLLARAGPLFIWAVCGALIASAAAVRMGLAGETLVVRWLPLFAMGVAAFRFFTHLSPWRSFLLVEGAAISAAAVMGRPLGVVAGCIAVAVLAFCTPRVPRILAAYAAMTYSLYLVHEPLCIRAVHLVQRLGEGPVILGAAIVAGIGVSLLAAYAFWWTVEKPSLRLAAMLKEPR